VLMPDVVLDRGLIDGRLYRPGLHRLRHFSPFFRSST
jgi:hypothetical protein